MAPGPLRAVDVKLIDTLFAMQGGYVLDFTDRTFARFFQDEVGVNIDDRRYEVDGTSKAKRLRFFLRTCQPAERLKALLALWEYRQVTRRISGGAEETSPLEADFIELIVRLGGKRPTPSRAASSAEPTSAVDAQQYAALQAELLAMDVMSPHERGFAYERFLKRFFDVNGLAPRASFRLVGEQIDGSFELAGETYLLEAKWTGPRIGAGELRAFEGKVADKAAWSRGLFVSQSGFTDEGLSAFGRGKRVVCMDGLDLYDLMQKVLPFAQVMARKIRRAAESGEAFVRVRDLFQ